MKFKDLSLNQRVVFTRECLHSTDIFVEAWVRSIDPEIIRPEIIRFKAFMFRGIELRPDGRLSSGTRRSQKAQQLTFAEDQSVRCCNIHQRQMVETRTGRGAKLLECPHPECIVGVWSKAEKSTPADQELRHLRSELFTQLQTATTAGKRRMMAKMNEFGFDIGRLNVSECIAVMESAEPPAVAPPAGRRFEVVRRDIVDCPEGEIEAIMNIYGQRFQSAISPIQPPAIASKKQLKPAELKIEVVQKTIQEIDLD